MARSKVDILKDLWANCDQDPNSEAYAGMQDIQAGLIEELEEASKPREYRHNDTMQIVDELAKVTLKIYHPAPEGAELAVLVAFHLANMLIGIEGSQDAVLTRIRKLEELNT